ncbi:tetratricopeptide repeat protein [Sphingomicrobium sp. XHP0239]|uniref:tetratricopeptide repeat protein n=1 Tax=Sphingomicrobium maritimum TaxID=3133972 RepID=UPI0031CC7E13
MKAVFTALTLALTGTALTAMPATANAQDAEQYKPQFSQKGGQALAKIQTAMTDGQMDAVPGLITAAENQVETADDRFVLGQLKLNYAVETENLADMYAALKMMRDSNSPQIDRARLGEQFLSVSDTAYRVPNYALSADIARDAVALDPNSNQAVLFLADSIYKSGDAPKAFATYKQYIDQRNAAGQTVPEEWYQRAVGLAYNEKVPGMMPLAARWVSAYPTDANWREVVALLQDARQYSDAEVIDVLRFQRAVGVMPQAGDYAYLADQLLAQGFPGEAKAVMDDGVAKGIVDPSNSTYAEVIRIANEKARGDRASLDSVEAATANQLRGMIATADAYYGYGDYANAVAIYQAALSRDGVDANTVNLRLGMAAGMNGDMATANAAFDRVGGNYDALADLWQAWFATQG